MVKVSLATCSDAGVHGGTWGASTFWQLCAHCVKSRHQEEAPA